MKKVITAGKMNVDIFFLIDKIDPGTNHVSEESRIDLGGKAANVAVALSKLGVSVSITGCVGSDMLGDFIKGELERYGVDTQHVKTCGEQSGRTAIIVDSSGENTMMNFPGANRNFSPEMIDWTLIEDGDVLFVQFGIPADTIFEISSMAKRAGMMVYADPSFPAEVPWDAFVYFDYLSPNERELLGITGKSDVDRAVRHVLKRGVETLILKMGDRGLKIFSEKVEHKVDPVKTDVVDTTGAGDSFNACFIYGRLNRMTDEESALLGSVCASITISRFGTSSAFPTLDEIRERLKELDLNLRV